MQRKFDEFGLNLDSINNLESLYSVVLNSGNADIDINGVSFYTPYGYIAGQSYGLCFKNPENYYLLEESKWLKAKYYDTCYRDDPKYDDEYRMGILPTNDEAYLAFVDDLVYDGIVFTESILDISVLITTFNPIQAGYFLFAVTMISIDLVWSETGLITTSQSSETQLIRMQQEQWSTILFGLIGFIQIIMFILLVRKVKILSRQYDNWYNSTIMNLKPYEIQKREEYCPERIRKFRHIFEISFAITLLMLLICLSLFIEEFSHNDEKEQMLGSIFDSNLETGYENMLKLFDLVDLEKQYEMFQVSRLILFYLLSMINLFITLNTSGQFRNVMKVQSTIGRYMIYLFLTFSLIIMIFSCLVYLVSAYYNKDYQDIDWSSMTSFKLSLGEGFAKNYLLLSSQQPVASVFLFTIIIILEMVVTAISIALIAVIYEYTQENYDDQKSFETIRFKHFCFFRIPKQKEKYYASKQESKLLKKSMQMEQTQYLKGLNQLSLDCQAFGESINPYSIQTAAEIRNEVIMRRNLRNPVLHIREYLRRYKKMETQENTLSSDIIYFNTNYISYLHSTHNLLIMQNYLVDALIDHLEDRIRKMDQRRIDEKANQKDVIEFIMYLEQPLQQLVSEFIQLREMLVLLGEEERIIISFQEDKV